MYKSLLIKRYCALKIFTGVHVNRDHFTFASGFKKRKLCLLLMETLKDMTLFIGIASQIGFNSYPLFVHVLDILEDAVANHIC